MSWRWFKVRKPEDPNKLFFAKDITVYPTSDDVRNRTNPKRVNVVHIRGNMKNPTMFEVNGEYLVSMLDAYSELNKEELPNLQMHQDFLSTVMEHAAEYKGSDVSPKSLIDRDQPQRIEIDGKVKDGKLITH